MRISLRCLGVSLVASILLTSCSNDSLLAPASGPIPLGQALTGTTSSTGVVTLTYPDSGGRYATKIVITDPDTRLPVAGMQVRAVAGRDGIYLEATDALGLRFPSLGYVPYAEYLASNPSSAANTSASRSTLSEAAIGVVTRYFIAANLVQVGGFIAQYEADALPQITNIYNDKGVLQSCFAGENLVKAIELAGNVMSFGRFGNALVVIRGAPAKLKGVTTIAYGITRKEFKEGAWMNAYAQVLQKVSGITNNDQIRLCIPSIGDQILDLLDIEVTRKPTDFDITRVDAQPFYPVVPSGSQITTGVNIQWSGNVVFPVTAYLTNVTCYPGWTCYDNSHLFKTSSPVLTPTFGCTSSDPGNKSGSITYQVQLVDAGGKKSSIATFNTRCGSG